MMGTIARSLGARETMHRVPLICTPSAADRPLRGSSPLQMRVLMGTLQSHYPEMLHRVVIAHAPSSFSRLFSLISPVLNERMLAKVGWRLIATRHATDDHRLKLTGCVCL